MAHFHLKLFDAILVRTLKIPNRLVELLGSLSQME
jgi:hypothetical protein